MTAARFPTIVIAGAPKSGTSSVYEWLTSHPEVGGAREKELGFFVDEGFSQYRRAFNVRSCPLEDYASQFQSKVGARHFVEATPTYLYATNAVSRLPDIPGKPKFLFLLREPSRQIYSVFSYFRNNYLLIDRRISFAEFIAASRAGRFAESPNEIVRHCLDYARYVQWLLRWREACGHDRIRIYLFEEVSADQRGFMRRVAADLGIDPTFYDRFVFGKSNETYHIRSELLQRFNVRVRNAIPRGRGFNALRSAYRALNTWRARPSLSDEDKTALSNLRTEFRAANAELADTFRLDLQAWAA